MRDLRVPISSLLRHYLKKRQEQPRLRFDYCLALIREWVRILQRDAHSDLKAKAYNDICMHGTSIYHEVIVNFCSKIVQPDQILNMAKKDGETKKELFDKANNEMSDLLTKNVPTFDRNNIVRLPT